MIAMRSAKQGDFDRCLALDTLIFGIEKRKEFLRERIDLGRMYVATENDKVAGFITFETNFIGCLYISLLLVHPGFRRRGIARRLVEKVAKHSRNGKLFSSTEADNDISIRMHEALGFRQSGYVDNLPQREREIIYYKDVD